jgi:hypothetical protein
MWGSSNMNEPPNLRRRGLMKGRFTIHEEEPATYPHTFFGPVTYMGTVITKQATQCIPWVNTRSTIETIEEVINILDTRSRCLVFTAAPLLKQPLKEYARTSLHASPFRYILITK